VSVLLPVRDEEPYLAQALESLSAQTLADLEVIVVDDGSQDGSAGIAEAHARRDRRFRVLQQPPRGMIAASEWARGKARARLVARMDGDDVALPERLELQAAAIEEEGLAAVGGQIEYFPAPTDGMRRYEAWLNGLVTVETAARDVFVECPLAGPALMARAEVLFYRDRGWPEDYDIVLRLWAAGQRFRNLEQLVLRWRDTPGRISRIEDRYSLDSFRRCKVHFLRQTLLVGGRPAVVWGAGPTGKALARELLRAGTPVAAFLDVDPRKLGKRIHGAPVVGVEEAGSFPRALALGAVAGAEGRARVREQAAALGLVEGVDFVAAA
jgi:glycosyltransferase involved in cell wall biosynthesis